MLRQCADGNGDHGCKTLRYFPGNNDRENSDRYNTICRMMVYIKDHIQEDLSRDRLAKMFGFSPSYLSRLFREYSGVCLQEYIVKCRVQKAIFLLKTGKYSVLDAALESGFRSSSGFYRAFHKATGQSPTEIKKTW